MILLGIVKEVNEVVDSEGVSGTETGKVVVYSIKGTKVLTECFVTKSGTEVSCTCQSFKLKNTCDHLKFAGEIKICAEDVNVENDLSIVYIPAVWNVLIVRQNKVVNVSTNVGNISASQLIDRFINNNLSDTGGVFQGQRVFEELKIAFTKNISLDSTKIAALGRGFKSSEETKPTEKSVERDLSWKEFEKPDSKRFWVSDEVWDQCLYAAHKGINLLLLGPAGSGKSQICYELAKTVGLTITPFNMGAMSEPRSSLIGNTHLGKDGTWFEKSRFVRSVDQESGIVLLDELTRAVRDAFNILLPLMDDQGYLALDESEDAAVIHRGEKVSFFATANVGMEYTGTDAIDKALKDRFSSVIEMDFPPAANEIEILISRCTLSRKEATKLVDIANRQRDLARREDVFTELVSTRLLLSAGDMISSGINFRVACRFAIENSFSPEGGEESERTKIKQLVQKIG